MRETEARGSSCGRPESLEPWEKSPYWMSHIGVESDECEATHAIEEARLEDVLHHLHRRLPLMSKVSRGRSFGAGCPAERFWQVELHLDGKAWMLLYFGRCTQLNLWQTWAYPDLPTTILAPLLSGECHEVGNSSAITFSPDSIGNGKICQFIIAAQYYVSRRMLLTRPLFDQPKLRQATKGEVK